jgi:hypothetical protein
LEEGEWGRFEMKEIHQQGHSASSLDGSGEGICLNRLNPLSPPPPIPSLSFLDMIKGMVLLGMILHHGKNHQTR